MPFHHFFHDLPEFFMNAVKCNSTELTKKSTCIPLYVLVDRSMAYGQEVFSADFVVAAHHPGSSPPTPFPSLFPLFQQCHWCLFLLCMRAHGCFAWICQPWEQSSSRSWLPVVEPPGRPRHPTSIYKCICSNTVVNGFFDAP